VVVDGHDGKARVGVAGDDASDGWCRHVVAPIVAGNRGNMGNRGNKGKKRKLARGVPSVPLVPLIPERSYIKWTPRLRRRSGGAERV
jgi:hypothetical protein